MHFEGSTYKESFAQESATILKVTTYSDSKKKISFGDYYKRHALAHTRLGYIDKTMTTEQKIGSFVQGM